MNAAKTDRVRIAVREAPFKASVENESSVVEYSLECPNSVMVEGNVYKFDCVFTSKATQAELYQELVYPLVLKVIAGQNCSVLAYGQTGSGKSYTMGLHANAQDEAHIGIIPRCVTDIFENLENLPAHTGISASFIEVYNEKVYDLLSSTSDEPIISHNRKYCGSKVALSSRLDVLQLLSLGNKQRRVRATKMNATSSRSHAIFSIYLRSELKNATLKFVDLAGTEGLRRTGHTGVAREEGIFINQGLLCINKVCLSISAGHRVIPYRDSVLTTVLQDSLSLQSYVTLVTCISPYTKDLNETKCTLRFAKNAKVLKTTPKEKSIIKKWEALQKSNPKLVESDRRSPSKRPLSKKLQPLSAQFTMDSCTYSTIPHNFSNATELQRNMEATTEKNQGGIDIFNSTLQSVDFVDIISSTMVTGSPQRQTTKAADVGQLQYKYEDLLRQFTSLQERCARMILKNTGRLSNVSDFLGFTNYSSTHESTMKECNEQSPKSRALCNMIQPPCRATPIDSDEITTERSPPAVKSQRQSQRQPQRRSKRFLNNKMSSNLSISFKCHQQDQKYRRSKRLATVGKNVCLRTKRDTSLLSSQHTVSLTPIKEGVKPVEEVLPDISQERTLDNVNSHRSTLLSLLNSGTVEQLMELPRIGPKTARCLVLKRSMVGSFQNWEQVQQLDFWGPSAYARFAAANCLSD